MPRPRSRVRTAVRGTVPVAAVACACVLAGCGGSDDDAPSTSTAAAPAAGTTQVRLLRIGRVERAIVRSIEQQRDITATVECPARQRQQEGLTFECVARFRLAGRTGRQRAIFTVEQGRDGNVTYAAR